MRSTLSRLVAVLLLLVPLPTRAQEDIEQDAQAWLLSITQARLGGRFRGYLEVQPRFAEDVTALDKLLVRAAVGWAPAEGICAWAGYAAVAGFLPSPGVEHRAWEQLQVDRPVGGVTLTSRTRAEQRFLTDGVSHRFRQMGRVLVPVSADGAWAVAASEEIFLNLNEVGSSVATGPDQNRAFLGLHRVLHPAVRVEGGYLHHYVWKPDGPDRVNHTALVAVFANL